MLKLGDQDLLPLVQAAKLVDIGGGAKPFDDFTDGIAHRRRAGMEPAIAVRVGFEEPIFDFKPACLHGLRPTCARRVAVVRMHGLQPAAAAALFLRLARIFVHCGVAQVQLPPSTARQTSCGMPSRSAR